MKLYLKVCLVLLLTVSCQVNHNNLNEMVSKPLQPIYVYNNLFLGRPYQIEVIDSILVIAENVNDTLLSFYNIKDSTLLCRRFSVGQGPDDLLNPIILETDKEKKQLFLLQRQNGVITSYNFNKLLEGNLCPVQKVELASTDRFVKIDSGYICTGFYEKGIACLLDDEGNILSDDIPFSPEYVAEVSDRVFRYKVSQGHIAYNKGVLAFASYFAGEVRFYQLKEGNWVNFRTEYFVNDDFTDRVKNLKENLQIRGDEIVHCYGIASGNDDFYVLYSGCKLSEQSNALRSFIYRFDKSGNCMAKYETNNYIIDFCVSGNEMYCIAQTHEGELLIMKYMFL